MDEKQLESLGRTQGQCVNDVQILKSSMVDVKQRLQRLENPQVFDKARLQSTSDTIPRDVLKHELDWLEAQCEEFGVVKKKIHEIRGRLGL